MLTLPPMGHQFSFPPPKKKTQNTKQREKEKEGQIALEEAQLDWLFQENQITRLNFPGPWAASWDIRWAEIGHYWRLSGWRILILVITAQLAIQRLLTPRSTE